VKPEKVNKTDRKSDSESDDSSWFVQAGNETIEEGEAKWVAGDGIDNKDTVMKDPVKPMKPETVRSNSGSDANDDVKIVKDHGVRCSKGDGFDDSEDTVEINEDTGSIRMKTGPVAVSVRVGDNGHPYWVTLEHEGRGRNESCLVGHDWNENKNWKKFLKKLYENFRHPKNW
jgi:hypothetical protein